MKFVDKTGMRFGKLVVIANHSMQKRKMWDCICDCGNQIIVGGENLSSGHTISCGCFRVENTTSMMFIHGYTKHPLYVVWKNMKARCYNEKSLGYKYYGARGISICEEWRNDAKIFIEWSLNNGWTGELEINRKDNDGNYCPENCNFINHKENSTNRRNKRN